MFINARQANSPACIILSNVVIVNSALIVVMPTLQKHWDWIIEKSNLSYLLG
jgi:hypothetical protein